MIISQKIINKNWFKLFFQINVVLFLLIFSGDTVSSLLRSNVTIQEIGLNQLFTLPNILLKTIPISCLLTSIMLVNKLINTSELTAIYSLGFSPKDFLNRVLNLSFGAFLLTLVLSGFIQPKLLQIKSENFNFLENKFRQLKKQGLISSKIANGKMWYKSGNNFLNYSTFNQQTNEISKYESFSIQNGKVTSSNFAKKLTLSNDSKWKTQDHLAVENIDTEKFNTNDITNKDEKISIPLNKKDIRNLEQDILSLNIVQFKKYINQLDKDGVGSNRYKVTFWQKISICLSCIVFSMIGLTGLTNSNKRSKSMGASIGLTIIIVIAYWFLDSFLVELGKNSKINIYLSTFGALVTAVALLLLIRIKQIIREF